MLCVAKHLSPSRRHLMMAAARFLIEDQKACLVEASGIEPLTYWLQTSRSPS